MTKLKPNDKQILLLLETCYQVAYGLKTEFILELDDESYHTDLAFTVNFTNHLNELCFP